MQCIPGLRNVGCGDAGEPEDAFKATLAGHMEDVEQFLVDKMIDLAVLTAYISEEDTGAEESWNVRRILDGHPDVGFGGRVSKEDLRAAVFVTTTLRGIEARVNSNPALFFYDQTGFGFETQQQTGRLAFSPLHGPELPFRSMEARALVDVLRERFYAVGLALLPPFQYIVLSDVDDTLLPAHNFMAGSDRSYVPEERGENDCYPGVVDLYADLGRWNKLDAMPFHCTFLTARPPRRFAIKKRASQYAELRDRAGGMISFLPGEGALMGASQNALLIGEQALERSLGYEDPNALVPLGDAKVQRALEYQQLFPEANGHFVFIGDDGQRDLGASRALLKLGFADPASGGRARPVFAFCAIHAIRVSHLGRQEFRRPKHERDATTRSILNELQILFPMEKRQRFFYFEDYTQLRQMITQTGWMVR